MRIHLPLTLALLALTLGCSKAGRECVGGLATDGGVCIGKCDPSTCEAGNRCVNNECKLACESFTDCIPIVQDCVEATEDTYADGGGGGSIKICQNAGSHSEDVGKPCPVGDECEKPLLCVSQGPGDGEAYCAEVGCTEDSCAPGYVCGLTRDPRRICGTSKGNNTICGMTDDPCVEADEIVPPLVEGPQCLLRQTCIKPQQCSACDSDADCAYGQNLACGEVDGENRCLPRCSPKCEVNIGDCSSSACDENGNSGVGPGGVCWCFPLDPFDGTDTCLRGSDCNPDSVCVDDVCKPRFDSCNGNGGFCEPCLNDLDCDDASGESFCLEFQDGQFACTNPCSTTGDCSAPPDPDVQSGCYTGLGYCGGVGEQGLLSCW